METLTTIPASTGSAPSRAGILFPSMVDFFFGALLLWLFVGGGGKSLLGDGDTGWHIRTGDYILEHRAVPRKDIFTFTKPDEPWFAWEWLTDVIFAKLHQTWGLKGIVLLAGVLLCGMATILFCHMMWSGGNVFFALAASLLANGASTVHFLARPHVFTFLLLALSLWILARDRRRPDGAIWLLAPLTAVWVNLHGGFLAVIVCLGLTAAGYGLQWLFSRSAENLFFLRRYSILAALCSLATLVNPYGYRLHLHILEYLRSSFVMDAVQEFQSPTFRGENMLQFEFLLFAGLAAAGVLLTKKRFVEALLILFWAQASLTSVRHVPIFVIVAAPILVVLLTEFWTSWTIHKSRNSITGILRDLGAEFSSKSLRVSIWVPVIVFAMGISMTRAKGDTWPEDFPKVKFPVALVNQYTERLAPMSGQIPRTFTSDQWGDYLTYRLYPRIRVFVDGRSDLFGPALGREYVHVAGGNYEWESLLDRYRIDMALVPIDWPLAELLKRSPRWRLVKDDGLGILFERRTPVLMKTEVSAERLNINFKEFAPMSKTISSKVETRSNLATREAVFSFAGRMNSLARLNASLPSGEAAWVREVR
jgi:hypothetical protein